MTPIPRILTAEPVIHGVLKIRWDDGYDGVVDLRPAISKGRALAFLQDQTKFSAVRLGEHGHAVFWLDEDDNVIDFGSDGLRTTAEKQAALHTLAG